MKKHKKSSKQWWRGFIVDPFLRLVGRIKRFLARRPHRSFRRTRRRDYARSLSLPGYWSFTFHVMSSIWQGRRVFGVAALVYAVVSALVVGMASQEVYGEMGRLLREAGQEMSAGGLGSVGEAGLLLAATISSNLNGVTTPEGQVYASLIALLFWLLLVWLLRAQLAGRKARFRDGLYSSGAPLVSTLLVLLGLLVQLLPLAIAVIIYSAGVGSGVLTDGVGAMLIWMAIILLGTLSLYWSISTILALVVVTLPGMYPMQAIRTAGDLVIGRRVRIFLRLLWMILVVAVIWALVMIPVIIGDSLLKEAWEAVAWLPIVPLTLLAMVSLTLLFSAAYIYLLYRKIVDDDAKPA